MFARMILLIKQQRLDLKDVLTHSLGRVSYPMASCDGSMAKTTKAVVVQLNKDNWPFPKSNAIPTHAAVIIDMMSKIHSFLKTSTPINYADFASLLL